MKADLVNIWLELGEAARAASVLKGDERNKAMKKVQKLQKRAVKAKLPEEDIDQALMPLQCKTSKRNEC